MKHLTKREYLSHLGRVAMRASGSLLFIGGGLLALGLSFVLGIAAGLEHQAYPNELRIGFAVFSFALFITAGALCYRGFDTLWSLDQSEQVVLMKDVATESLPEEATLLRASGPPTHLDHLLLPHNAMKEEGEEERKDKPG